MKIIITGGAGFIGGRIAKTLVKKRHRIKIIDNLSNSSLNNLKDIKKYIEFVKCDIRHFNKLKKEFLGWDIVLHHAAAVSVPESIKNPKKYNDINIKGTVNVLESSKICGIKKVVYASSCSVYGNSGRKKTIKCESPYSLSKFIGEEYCKLYSKLYGLKTIILRYFNVYGFGQNAKNGYAAVIPSFVNRLIKGKKPIIYGDGLQTRDFIYIDDIVNANLKAIKKHAQEGVFDIGTGKSISINRLFKTIKDQVLKLAENKKINIDANKIKSIKPIYKSQRIGDVRESKSNLKTAEKNLGFEPKTNLKQGLELYLIDYIKHYGKQL